MIDTLNANFYPQFRPDPRTYMAQLFTRMAPYRQGRGRLRIRVMPDDSNVSIAAGAAFEGRVSVPTGSRLFAISGSSSSASGFDLQIRNAETQAPLFSRRTFYANATGQVAADDLPTSRLFFVPRPLLFTSDKASMAQVAVQVWNKDTAAANSIQLLLWFWTPETL